MYTELENLLTALPCAAFTVRDDTILFANAAALQLGVVPGAELAPLLPEDCDPAALAAGASVSLPALGEHISAAVTAMGDLLIFSLHRAAPTLDPALLTRTAQILRLPLDDLSTSAEALFTALEEWEDPTIQCRTAQLNRSFYRLLHIVSDLSELDRLFGSTQPVRRQRTELAAFFGSFTDRLAGLVEETGRTLRCIVPQQPFYGYIAPQLLERACLSLVSNAVRCAPAGSEITLQVQRTDGFCRICADNPGGMLDAQDIARMSAGYRYPLLPDTQPHGMGLGILLARAIAQLHGGTLLLQARPQGGLRACLQISLQPVDVRMHAGQMEVDTLGGFDPLLTALADILPDRVFDTRGL